jgi:hypothetical protein
MTGTRRRASCRELFKKFNILPLACEFLLSLLSFVVDNLETFQTNSDIHNISTKYRYKFKPALKEYLLSLFLEEFTSKFVFSGGCWHKLQIQLQMFTRHSHRLCKQSTQNDISYYTLYQLTELIQSIYDSMIIYNFVL